MNSHRILAMAPGPTTVSNAPVSFLRPPPDEEFDAHRAEGLAIAVGGAAILWVLIITVANALVHSIV